MSEDNRTPMTPEEEDKNAGVERDENGEVKSEATSNKYQLEDGRVYNPGDTLKIETKEYHQTTHYLNREIDVDSIIEEFGSLQNFEKGLYTTNWSDATDEEKELADKVSDFVQEHDYERHEDCWTFYKGGYDVDEDIVEEFTMTESR